MSASLSEEPISRSSPTSPSRLLTLNDWAGLAPRQRESLAQWKTYGEGSKTSTDDKMKPRALAREEMYEAAKAKQAAEACTVKVGNNVVWRPLSTSSRELGVYSAGVGLYFGFLEQLSWVLLAASFLTMPGLVACAAGSSLGSYAHLLARTSIANVGSCRDSCSQRFVWNMRVEYRAGSSFVQGTDG